MNFCPTLNPMITLIYILIVFVISTESSSWNFDNDEDPNWGQLNQGTPTDCAESSRPSPLPSTQKEIENAFWNVYNEIKEWPLISRDKKVLRDTCYAAWNVSPNTYDCEAAPYPHSIRTINLEVSRMIINDIDLLQCKCLPLNLPRKTKKEVFQTTAHRYLAQYNDSAVFVFVTTGGKRSNKWIINEMANI